MTTQTPLVAIKCITYNQAAYIRQCLDGFVMQRTDFDFVAIVHDDCSTDGTDDIVREYAQRYPNIIKPIFETENQYSKGDGSLSRIMTQACNNTGAKYIAMCEGDDYWTDPQKLQKQVDYMEAHPECSCCVHDYKKWIENEKKFIEHKLAPLIGYEGKGLTFNCDEFASGIFFTKTLTALFRQSSLNNSKYSSYYLHFDMALFYALSTQGDIYLMNETMGVYRINDGGVYCGTAREKFLNSTNPYMHTLCKIEKTAQSKKYVYNYLKRYVVLCYLHPHKYNLISTLYYLGAKWGAMFFARFLAEMRFYLIRKFKRISSIFP